MKKQLTKSWGQMLLLALFVLGGLDAGVARAQENTGAVEDAAASAKIGVIDVRRLVSDSDAGKAALAELEALRDAKGADLEVLSSELDQLQTQITEGRLSLSQERLGELNREFEDKSTAYRRAVQDAEREMQEAQARNFSTIEREVLPLIQELGDEQAYSLILSITDGGVVYAPQQVNITDEVVARYNASRAAKAAGSEADSSSESSG